MAATYAAVGARPVTPTVELKKCAAELLAVPSGGKNWWLEVERKKNATDDRPGEKRLTIIFNVMLWLFFWVNPVFCCVCGLFMYSL